MRSVHVASNSDDRHKKANEFYLDIDDDDEVKTSFNQMIIDANEKVILAFGKSMSFDGNLCLPEANQIGIFRSTRNDSNGKKNHAEDLKCLLICFVSDAE